MSEEFYKTSASAEEYIKAAEGFDGQKLITKLKNYLAACSSLLEIGSGPGTDWKIINGYFESVVGSDNSIEFLKRLRANHPDGKFLELDATTLTTDQTFDAIYSNKVLHHLKDEDLKASFKRQAELLVPAGVICHSFWKGEGSEVFKGLFVNYHTTTGIQDLFDDHFKILLMREYHEFEDNDSILVIAKKK